ncbi:hypothetical protein Tco_1231934 [Tanacetum coccineum]
MSNDPLPQEIGSEGHTSGSEEGCMEHTFELMDIVPPTPNVSLLKGSLTGGKTPKGCNKLWRILQTKQRVKKLKEEEVKHLDTPRRRIYRQVESSDDDLDEEDASKQGRESDKTKSITPVTTTGVAISTAKPRTPPTTTATTFIDEDLTIAQTLIKMKEEKYAALAEEFDEIQARIDADHELVVRLTHEEQEKYTIEERTRLLAELFDRRKKQLVVERAKEIRNKPPTRTQVKNGMITYLKHMGKYTHQQLKNKNFEEVKITKKRPRAYSEEESSKKQKLEEDNDAKKEDVVPRDDVAIDVESLATKYPIIDWKTYILNENMMYYQIIIADGCSKNYKIFSEMLDDFDRQHVIDLHRLPHKEDEIWKNQQDYNLIRWRLFESCGIHVLLMNTGVAIHMMIEKKYPLTQEMISRMLNRRLKVDYESEMAFELLYNNLQFSSM